MEEEKGIVAFLKIGKLRPALSWIHDINCGWESAKASPKNFHASLPQSSAVGCSSISYVSLTQ
jgi:hypothetical protein